MILCLRHLIVSENVNVPFIVLIIDIDECANSETNKCDPNALCTNTEGSYVCRCMKGFEGDGQNCTGKCRYEDLPLLKVKATNAFFLIVILHLVSDLTVGKKQFCGI